MSIFGPKILEEHQSKYSGPVRLMQGWGYKYVSTGILTQSGGVVEDVWRPVLKKIGRTHKTWLILGLGCGTVAKMISARLSPTAITGVDIDPLMLDLGRRHFALEHIPGLTVIRGDASRFVARTRRKFDFILVDLYLGDKLPAFVYTAKFLDRLRALGRSVVFNHLFYDDSKRQAAGRLVAKVGKIFPRVELVRSLTNILIVARAKPEDNI